MPEPKYAKNKLKDICEQTGIIRRMFTQELQ